MTLAELMLNDLKSKAVEAYRQSITSGEPRPDSWTSRADHQQAMKVAVAAVLKAMAKGSA